MLRAKITGDLTTYLARVIVAFLGKTQVSSHSSCTTSASLHPVFAACVQDHFMHSSDVGARVGRGADLSNVDTNWSATKHVARFDATNQHEKTSSCKKWVLVISNKDWVMIPLTWIILKEHHNFNWRFKTNATRSLLSRLLLYCFHSSFLTNALLGSSKSDRNQQFNQS